MRYGRSDIIGHFHAAGHPGRRELWLGETHCPVVVREIEKAGYAGVFAFEDQPTLAQAGNLKRTLDCLRRS